MIVVVLVGGVVFAASRLNDPDVNCDTPQPSLTAWSRGGDAQTDEGYRLVACDRLIGLTAIDVERLLGPPGESHDNGQTYEMGPDGLGIDSIFLGVNLKDGRVVSASVLQG
jgi:hypothetical protein